MIEKIRKYSLCMGCGLCSSFLGKEKCQMELCQNGFFLPKVQNPLSNDEKNKIKSLCPGISVISERRGGIWGPVQSICQAWSADSSIRHIAASGGVVTSLAQYLIESGKVDAVLQVGVKQGSYLLNEMKVSHTSEEIIANAQSRYAPALTFNDIFRILDSGNEKYALIGKPCDIAACKNLVTVFPQYKERFKVCISIFCAGIPSYNATVKLWQQSGHTDEPIALRYRGNGWPGKFMAFFKDGTCFERSYAESWGDVLGKDLCFRCKICPDGIGSLADISVGDAWNTKDGYPDFSESEGRSFCMIRNHLGAEIMEESCKQGFIVTEELSLSKIKEQQPYQFQRRKLEGWRIVPVQIITGGMLNFRKLSIYNQALRANILDGLRNLVGTYKRMKMLNGE